MDDSRIVLYPVLGFLAITTLPIRALAIPTRPCQSAPPENPAAHYLATFELKSGVEKPQAMVFCVNKPQADPDQAAISAEIWSKEGREALCKHTYFEREGGAPVSMILECKSTRLGPLNTPVTLYWPSGEIAQPVLRFGTWLQGYMQTPLLVKVDHFTPSIRVAKGD